MNALQEAGNVPYVVEGGFGVYCGNKPRRIADTVQQWFKDESLLKQMSNKAILQSHPEATEVIAVDIGAIALRTTISTPKLS